MVIVSSQSFLPEFYLGGGFGLTLAALEPLYHVFEIYNICQKLFGPGVRELDSDPIIEPATSPI